MQALNSLIVRAAIYSYMIEVTRNPARVSTACVYVFNCVAQVWCFSSIQILIEKIAKISSDIAVRVAAVAFSFAYLYIV